MSLPEGSAPAPHPTRPTPQNLLVKVLALVPQPRVGALPSPGGEQEPAGAAFIPTCVSGEGWGKGPPRAGHPPVSAVVLGVLGCCVGLFRVFFSFFFPLFPPCVYVSGSPARSVRLRASPLSLPRRFRR